MFHNSIYCVGTLNLIILKMGFSKLKATSVGGSFCLLFPGQIGIWSVDICGGRKREGP